MARFSRKIFKQPEATGGLLPPPATQHLVDLAVACALDEELRAALEQAQAITINRRNRFKVEGLIDSIELELESRARREKRWSERGQ